MVHRLGRFLTHRKVDGETSTMGLEGWSTGFITKGDWRATHNSLEVITADDYNWVQSCPSMPGIDRVSCAMNHKYHLIETPAPLVPKGME